MTKTPGKNPQSSCFVFFPSDFGFVSDFVLLFREVGKDGQFE